MEMSDTDEDTAGYQQNSKAWRRNDLHGEYKRRGVYEYLQKSNLHL